MAKKDKSKKLGFEEEKSSEEEIGAASRARNRTVMLTPDMAGNIRARLMESGVQKTQERSDTDAGFMSPLNRDGSGAENLRDATRMIRREDIENSEAFSESSKKDLEQDTAEFSKDQVDSLLGNVAEEEYQAPEQIDPVVSHAKVEPEPFVSVEAEAPVKAAAVVTPPVVAGSSSIQAVSQGDRKRLIGFLVSFDSDENGEFVELRSGRWLVTSQPSDHGDYILIKDKTISPLHAIVRVSDKGVVQVLDQLSEYGTGITSVDSSEEEDVAGVMANASNGDIIRFGERSFHVCLIPVRD